MRGLYGKFGLAVLCVGLAGWAALALAQSTPGRLPSADSQPADPIPLQVPDSGPVLVPTSGQAPAPSVPLPSAPVPSVPLPPAPNPPLPGVPFPAAPNMPQAVPSPAVPLQVPGQPTQPVPLPSGPLPSVPLPGTPLTTPAMPQPPQAEAPRTGRLLIEGVQRVGTGVIEEPVPQSIPGQTPENPTGRQEPAVSLEWVGPPVAKVGQPADFSLVVRNACNIPVQQVMVRVRIPQGMNLAAAEPKAVTENNVLMWELGTMQPKQERNLQMKLLPETKGDVGCQAWVTFTGASTMRVRVREPKLLLKAAAPDKVLIGDAAAFSLTVSNPGDGPAELVKVKANLSDGLEHARGKMVEFDVGNLAPGETRSVQLICTTKTGGLQKCEAVAEADGGLRSQDQAAVNVIMPRLDIEANGPKLRYLDRKATYTFKVTNPGDAPALNVMVTDLVPPGFKFVAASDGGRHDFATRTVSWFLGEVGPGQAREVKLDVVAVNPGEHKHRASAQAARGLKVETEVQTRVEGLSALLLEVIDVEDPVEVGADTSYEIRVTNTGSKTETDIRLSCLIPDKMEFKGAQGATSFHLEGKTVVFDPLPKLAPRADAIYRINVKGISAGDVRFKAQITSTNLMEPVMETEATRIYDD